MNTITPLAAESALVSDWSTEALTDWFYVTSELTKTPMNDGVMGDFVRLMAPNGTDVPFAYGYGKTQLSPRHDFEIEFNVRVNMGSQVQVGFSSGAENTVAFEFVGAHNCIQGYEGPYPGNDTVPSLPNLSGVADLPRLWATCFPIAADGSAFATASTGWRYAPTAAHADYSKWQCALNALNVIKFKYIAATYTVELYVNGVLACTLGDTHAPPTQRKRFPVGQHYPLPIVPYIKANNMQYAAGAGMKFDIGTVRLSTACPYDYAAFTACESPQVPWEWYQDNYFGAPGFTLNTDLRAWVGLSGMLGWNTMRRYQVNLWPGYTLPPSNMVIPQGDGVQTDYAEWGLDEDENPILIPSDPQYPTYTAGTVTAKSPLIDVPTDKPVVQYAMYGYEQYGTLRCRLLDASNNPLNAYINVDGVYAVDLTAIDVDSIAQIRVEAEITYDGTAIDNTSPFVGGDMGANTTYGDFQSPTPNTPPLFVGFETYFGEREFSMASALSNREKARFVALNTTSSTRYKATLHNGASRPTVATTVYAATGLGELSTTTNYTTGGAGLTGGIQLVSTVTGDNFTFTDKTITTAVGETIGPVDTVAIWDTADSNGLVAILDYVASPKTASEGGTFLIDAAAVTIAVTFS